MNETVAKAVLEKILKKLAKRVGASSAAVKKLAKAADAVGESGERIVDQIRVEYIVEDVVIDRQTVVDPWFGAPTVELEADVEIDGTYYVEMGRLPVNPPDKMAIGPEAPDTLKELIELIETLVGQVRVQNPAPIIENAVAEDLEATVYPGEFD